MTTTTDLPDLPELLDVLDRITTELVGRGIMDERGAQKVMLASRSSDDYDTTATRVVLYRQMLKDAVSAEGDTAVYNLSPQLAGLEGWQVEVVDEEGDEPRRFLVATGQGWAPQHWEITAKAITDRPARREYHSVTEIKQVLP